MRSKLFSLLASLAAIALLLNSQVLQPLAYDTESCFEIIEQITEYKLDEYSYNDTEQWINGALTQSAGVDAEWYVIGLSRIGDYDFSNYSLSLSEYLSENDVGSASSRQKYALALIAADNGDSPYIGQVLEDSIGEQGIMSLVFGLHILNNGYESPVISAQDVKQKLLSLQLPDGGFAVMGTNSDVDVTAMAIASLAPFYETDSDVAACIDTALEFLSSKQNASGDFSSYGTDNAESTAQVLIALSSLNIDAAQDMRFIKNSNTLFDAILQYSLPSGAFSHTKGGEANQTATVQVFLAAVSYSLMLEDKGSLYDFSPYFADSDDENADIESNETKIDSSSVSETDVEENNALTSQESQSKISDTETLNRQNSNGGEKTIAAYKIWAIVLIIALYVVIGVAMLIAGKRNFKNFLVMTILAILCVIFVFATNFASAESYYKKDDLQYESYVTISISCDEIKNSELSHIPNDGVVLKSSQIGFCDGQSAYDVLLLAAKQNNIRIDASAFGNSVYVKGIADIYEFDFGELSGWMYYVNGEKPSVGCGEYKLAANDVIKWVYTCDYTIEKG